MHRDKIDGALLPLKYTSFTTAFRAKPAVPEEIPGYLETHQFNKVELIKLLNRKNLTTNSKKCCSIPKKY